ncbi:MAG TPA: hypothetical protein VEA78_12850, partial [Acidimicrobiales bacterium]|nr:hypothetical protein [Acidimicrobiales bacterium]
GIAECNRVLQPGSSLAVVEMDRDASLADLRAFAALTRGLGGHARHEDRRAAVGSVTRRL